MEDRRSVTSPACRACVAHTEVRRPDRVAAALAAAADAAPPPNALAAAR